MEPITVGLLLYGLYKASGKSSTPTSTASTASQIAAAAANIVANGMPAVNSINSQLKAQIAAMPNWTTGGTGFPGGFSAYITTPQAPWWGASQQSALTAAWNAYEHDYAAVSAMNPITTAAATQLTNDAIAVANLIYQYSQGEASYTAEMSQAQAASAAANALAQKKT